MSKSLLNRRQFLLGAGGTSLTLPLLPSLLTSSQLLAETASTKKVVFLVWSNGATFNSWFGDMTRLPFVSETSKGPNLRRARLSQISGPISPVWGTFADSNRNDFSILAGIDETGPQIDATNAHRPTFTLCADNPSQQCESVDQIIAKGISSNAPYKFIGLGCKAASVGTTGSVSKVGETFQTVPMNYDPVSVFNTYFASINSTQPSQDQIRQPLKLSVLDKVKAQLEAISKSSKLSANDVALLRSHGEEIRALERQIQSITPSQCTRPTAPVSPTVYSSQTHSANIDVQQDLLIQALKCGLTQVAVIQLASETDQFVNNGSASHEHAMDDAGGHAIRVARAQNIEAFYAAKFIRFIQRLKSQSNPVTGKSLFEETLVVMLNSAGSVIVHNTHWGLALPVVVGGGLAETGYFVDYRNLGVKRMTEYRGAPTFDSTHKVGRAYNDLLNSVTVAMGCPLPASGIGFQRNFNNHYGTNPRATLPLLVKGV